MDRALKAYIFYGDNGKIIPMSLILRRTRPRTNQRFIEISANLCCDSDGFPIVLEGATNKLRAWVKLDRNKQVVAGSLIIRKSKPKNGFWVQAPYSLCCSPYSTTTTSTSTTTSSTTTQQPG